MLYGLCCRLQEDIELVDTFESELSSLESWISGAMHNIVTVNKSLQTVPPNTEELVNVTKVLSVCCFMHICPLAEFSHTREL